MELKKSPVFEFLYEDDKGTKKISPSKLVDFLEINGFNFVCLDGKREIVRNVDGIVHVVSSKAIFDFLRGTLDNSSLREYYDVFAENPIRYVGGSKLQLLKDIELIDDRDPRDSSRFHFQNCFCEIHADSIVVKNYDELNSSIWEKRIIKKEFTPPKSNSIGQFHQWFLNITGKSSERFRALQSVIGFLLHRNKERGENKAIILYDEKMGQEEKANGRVGKSMIGEALKYCREVVINDGKTKNFNSEFANELITNTTDCVYYDDLPRNTNFENFYSFLTSGVEVNKKYKSAFTIDGSRSPKLIISSNYYVLGDGGDSDRARRYEFEICNYYSAKFQPEHEFGNRFWDSKWPQVEWDKFYDFMMRCVQVYLTYGLIDVEPINLVAKRIEDPTSPEFLEFGEAYFTVNEQLDKRELESNFKELYPKWNNLSSHIFYKWCFLYAHEKGLSFETKPSGGNYYCKFVKESSDDK